MKCSTTMMKCTMSHLAIGTWARWRTLETRQSRHHHFFLSLVSCLLLFISSPSHPPSLPSFSALCPISSLSLPFPVSSLYLSLFSHYALWSDKSGRRGPTEWPSGQETRHKRYKDKHTTTGPQLTLFATGLYWTTKATRSRAVCSPCTPGDREFHSFLYSLLHQHTRLGLGGLTSTPRRIYWSEQTSMRTRMLIMVDWVKRGIFGRDLSKF